jgi:predicted nucleic acid-binding protein
LPLTKLRNTCRRPLQKRGKSASDLSAALNYFRRLIEPIEHDVYAAFENEARARLHDRDEGDWPVLAAAIALACAIWTEDTDFFGTGVPLWTTNRIEIFLEEQTKSHESEE